MRQIPYLEYKNRSVRDLNTFSNWKYVSSMSGLGHTRHYLNFESHLFEKNDDF